MEITLEAGKTIAVIYRHPSYGEPDYKAEARKMIMDVAVKAEMPVVHLWTNEIALEGGCRVILIDETYQDQSSRGYRFDSVFVIPPASFIGDGIRRARSPNCVLASLSDHGV